MQGTAFEKDGDDHSDRNGFSIDITQNTISGVRHKDGELHYCDMILLLQNCFGTATIIAYVIYLVITSDQLVPYASPDITRFLRIIAL
uniref:Neur_chan_memb domain-containing protein n=1 Tax=Heterorhabditis bacteriophora TaxID=37862 RepID=A0A1I7XSQ5_HETBA